jgi:hypothetical protein
MWSRSNEFKIIKISNNIMNKQQAKIKIIQKLLERETGRKVILKEDINHSAFGGAINDLINEYKGKLSNDAMIQILQEEIGLLNSSFDSIETSTNSKIGKQHRKSIKADNFAHEPSYQMESKKINKKG